MVKFLVVRFSSIGDIVLTTPVLRGLKQQVENAEIHYLTKPQFKNLLIENPYIEKTHTLTENINDIVKILEKENFDYLIDLHKNLRTAIFKKKLQLISFSFDKLNLKKWLLVNLKINKMPKKHIVDRYLETVKIFDVTNDQQGLDFFIPKEYQVIPQEKHPALRGKYMSIVLGANHETKQIPEKKIIAIANGVGIPVCLLGGKDVLEKSEYIQQALKIPFLNTVGKINIHQSASFIEQSTVVLSPDTGMMHIAAAFKKNIVSLWGNTVPDFGMYPYLAGKHSKIFEINNLPCRPCSKIGYKTCPKKHFKCMKNIDNKEVVKYIQSFI